MRKSIIAVATAAVLGLPSMAAAQASANANMTVSANVIKALTLSKVSAGNLDFGTVAAGTNPSIAASGASAIQFQANGEANTPVTVTFSAATLNSGANVLTFTPSVLSFDANTQASATAVTSGQARALNGATGDLFFWVGGSLTIPGGQAAGTYTGTWTLSVAY